jgi:hypothetical protein
MVSQENIKNWSRSVQKWEGNKWRKHGLVWECSTLGLSLFMLPMGAIELWIQILYGFLLYTIPCGVIRQFTHPKYLFITLSVTRYTMLRDFNLHSNRCDVNKASLSFHLKSTKSNFVQQSRIKINMDSTRILSLETLDPSMQVCRGIILIFQLCHSAIIKIIYVRNSITISK